MARFASTAALWRAKLRADDKRPAAPAQSDPVPRFLAPPVLRRRRGPRAGGYGRFAPMPKAPESRSAARPAALLALGVLLAVTAALPAAAQLEIGRAHV